jgi:hypothetical protein
MHELRFLVSGSRRSALLAHLEAAAMPLPYRVTNVYFDDGRETFSQTQPGSPRFRLRLYEAGPWRFGHLELKVMGEEGRTRKRFWRLTDQRHALISLVPFLLEKPLRPAPENSRYGCLVRQARPGMLDMAEMRLLDVLSYLRISFQAGSRRMTLDDEFSPALVPRTSSLLEVKGGMPARERDELRSAFALEDLGESKFSLLRKPRR